LRDLPDFTAATRIAAASNSPWRHDQSCPVPQRQLSLESLIAFRQEEHESPNTISSEDSKDTKIRRAISDLTQVLERSSFNNEHVQRIFGISPCRDDEQHGSSRNKAKMLSSSQGPLYIKPVRAGDQIPLPFNLDELAGDEPIDDEEESSFKCLVAMFLLGFAVPKVILSNGIIGGDDTIALLEYLGLAFPCENDPSIIVPYVHLFPMDVNLVVDTQKPDGNDRNTIDPRESFTENDPRRKAVVFVTDCHPTVLSRTTVGKMEDGAVMYIGPDSLALVQHIPLQTHMTHIRKEDCGTSEQKSGITSSQPFKILDFCSGSGVQALSTLVALEEVEADATAVCVDVNDRALRFARFNALLNGISDNRIKTIKADLISGKLLKPKQHIGTMTGSYDRPKDTNIFDSDEGDLLETLMYLDSPDECQSAYDIILANPPFIPVPPSQRIDIQDGGSNAQIMHLNNSIAKRYGLFSSGGTSGEDILQSIMNMSPTLIRKDGGLLAIVSEFMNPPTGNSEINESYHKDLILLEKLERWWNLGTSTSIDSRNPTLAEGKGILFTNKYPVSAATYATRRADNKAEFEIWFHHMESERIYSVSPGLIFVETHNMKRDSLQWRLKGTRNSSVGGGLLSLIHQIVPKTESGSIWTPSNMNAIAFTSKKWLESITSIN